MYRIEKIDWKDREKMLLAKKIRHEVFCVEQKVSEQGDWDNKESTNYLLFCDEVPCATIRYRKVGRCVKIERLCVLVAYRNKGFARLLAEKVLEDLKGEKNKTIILHAQVYIEPFYESLGFVRRGKVFSEENILHYAMVKKA